MVVQSDDVAGIGHLHQRALIGHEGQGILDLDRLAVFKGLVLEGEDKLLGVESGLSSHENLCVRVNDAIHGETGTLDWVFVHFNNYN